MRAPVDAEVERAIRSEAARKDLERPGGIRHVREHAVARDEIEVTAGGSVKPARRKIGHEEPNGMPRPPALLQLAGDAD